MCNTKYAKKIFRLSQRYNNQLKPFYRVRTFIELLAVNNTFIKIFDFGTL